MIVYFSGATEFTHKFVEKLGLEAVRIPLLTKDAKVFTVDEDYILITPTYESKSQGFLPRQTASFLNIPENRTRMMGVIGAGNRNFGEDYAISADIISEKTGVPVLHRFELSGTQEDIDLVKEGLEEYWETLRLARSHQLTSTHS